MNMAVNLYSYPEQNFVLVRPRKKGILRKVSGTAQPVRKVTVGDKVSSGGTDPQGGQTFVVELMGGKTREVFVPADGTLLWDEAFFLKEGQKASTLPELLELEDKSPEFRVLPPLITKMKQALAAHNDNIRAAAAAKYGQKKAAP